MREAKTLEDAKIIIKELAQWKDRISSKNQDFKGLRIQNAGDGVDPGDYVTVRQLNNAVAATNNPDQHYSIPFSSTGVVINGQLSAPYIVAKNRVGVPTEVSLAVPTAAQAPTGVPLIINVAINGVNILASNLQLPVGQDGPVSSSQFINPLPKLTVGAKIVPVIIQAGGASLITVQLYVTRILSGS